MVMKPASGSWSPDPLIRTLKARDLWEHGGADKVADMLEAQEDTAKAANAQAIRDDLYNRSGDAWRSYQARTGASNIQFHDRPKSKTVLGAPAQVSESTVGLGRKRKPVKRRKRTLTIGR
jgi:hypothetical protein